MRPSCCVKMPGSNSKAKGAVANYRASWRQACPRLAAQMIVQGGLPTTVGQKQTFP